MSRTKNVRNSKKTYFHKFKEFLSLYELLKEGSYRPLKVLKFFVLKSRFQICKNHYSRPKGSGDIAFQSEDKFSYWASMFFAPLVSTHSCQQGRGEFSWNA